MTLANFENQGTTSKLNNYKNVPFTKIARLQFTQKRSVVNLKTTRDTLDPMNSANLRFS